MHPKLIDMIKYAKSKGLSVGISTNANLLTKEISLELVKSRLDLIRYSLEGSKKEEYERIRRGGNFEKVMDNVKNFKKIRDQFGKLPKIHINSVFMEGNTDTKGFYNVWGPYTDKIEFSFLSNQGEQVPDIMKKSLNIKETHNHPCHLLWGTIILTWDGFVTVCCVDFEGKLIVGNFLKEGLINIWHNAKYNQFRRFHRKGQFKKMPLCGNCSSRLVDLPYQSYKLNQKIKKEVNFNKN
jgi:radical SAM protein with 4Fe4S-binding SPASM domain